MDAQRAYALGYSQGMDWGTPYRGHARRALARAKREGPSSPLIQPKTDFYEAWLDGVWAGALSMEDEYRVGTRNPRAAGEPTRRSEVKVAFRGKRYPSLNEKIADEDSVCTNFGRHNRLLLSYDPQDQTVVMREDLIGLPLTTEQDRQRFAQTWAGEAGIPLPRHRRQLVWLSSTPYPPDPADYFPPAIEHRYRPVPVEQPGRKRTQPLGRTPERPNPVSAADEVWGDGTQTNAQAIPRVQDIQERLPWLEKLSRLSEEDAALLVHQAMAYAQSPTGQTEQALQDFVEHLTAPAVRFMWAEAQRTRNRDTRLWAALGLMDVVLETQGAEYRPARGDTEARGTGWSYLNVGDLHTPTVIYDHGLGRWYLAALSDVMKAYPERFDVLTENPDDFDDFGEAARIVYRFGDVNPTEHGGGIVLRGPDGTYQLEYTGGLGEAEDAGELDDYEGAEDQYALTVYRMSVPDDVFAYHDWTKPAEMARSLDTTPGEFRRRGRSPELSDRVWALEGIALYYGWPELDQYPLTYTTEELDKRWELSAQPNPAAPSLFYTAQRWMKRGRK